ncbi:MAG: PqiC family protein [Desulfovibrio sp.]|nr:PqiC family protein [Desulfovibrio sp.]
MSCLRFLPLVLFPILFTAGCGKSMPTRYYALQSEALSVSCTDLPKTTLRVAGVGVPSYLSRDALVERKPGEANLTIDSLTLWAEPLDDGIRRIFVNGLTAPLLEEGLTVLPMASEDRGVYTLVLDILTLDGVRGGEASLSLSWRLLENASTRILDSGLYSARASVPGEDKKYLVERWGDLLRGAREAIQKKICEKIGRRR